MARVDPQDALWEAHPDDADERGRYPGIVRKHSVYTAATIHRAATLLGVAAVGVGLALAARAQM